jgi:ABC-type ATPase involved in cell division
LKNLEPERVKREMVQMIKDVGLPHKKTELSSSLSGKEKLEITDTALYKVIKDVSFFFCQNICFVTQFN